jgi:hypothetical protein
MVGGVGSCLSARASLSVTAAKPTALTCKELGRFCVELAAMAVGSFDSWALLIIILNVR